jgi:hypothetical protein
MQLLDEQKINQYSLADENQNGHLFEGHRYRLAFLNDQMDLLS